MKCDTSMLFDYIDGTLRDEDIKEFEVHLQSCEACRETINTFNLMESIREYNYALPIDVVQSVRNSTNKDLYSNKKYLFINKYFSNKKSIMKYGFAATIALVLTCGIFLNNNYNFVDTLKNFAVATFSKDKNLQKELEDYTKSIISTPYYDNFMKLIEDKQYKVVADTIIGAPIQLPNNLSEGDVDIKVSEILNHGNILSIYNGLDFSGYLGKKVMLLTCIIEEPNNVTKELIVLMSGDKTIGFWEGPSIKDDKSQLDSLVLLKSLKVDKSDEEIKNGVLQGEGSIPLEKLPKIYTVEMAKSNGDVIYNSGENNNIFYKFLQSVENKESSKVRIDNFWEKDEATIIDLIYDNGNIKAIVDTTRNPSDGQGIVEYKVLTINKESKGTSIYYYAALENGKGLGLMHDELK